MIDTTPAPQQPVQPPIQPVEPVVQTMLPPKKHPYALIATFFLALLSAGMLAFSYSNLTQANLRKNTEMKFNTHPPCDAVGNEKPSTASANVPDDSDQQLLQMENDIQSELNTL